MSTVAEPDYDAPDTMVVSRPDQLKAMGDDLRTQIIHLLRNRARSTQELSAELGIPKGTVGHHVKVLERAGLIHVVRTRQVRAVTEKFYGRTARLFLFEAEDPADERAIGASVLRQAASEVERSPGGAAFGLVRARLAEKDIERFGRRAKRLLEEFRAADGAGGEPAAMVLTWWTGEQPHA
jgi:DNA-binding transcriptional ArsR family regulator